MFPTSEQLINDINLLRVPQQNLDEIYKAYLHYFKTNNLEALKIMEDKGHIYHYSDMLLTQSAGGFNNNFECCTFLRDIGVRFDTLPKDQRENLQMLWDNMGDKKIEEVSENKIIMEELEEDSSKLKVDEDAINKLINEIENLD